VWLGFRLFQAPPLPGSTSSGFHLFWVPPLLGSTSSGFHLFSGGEHQLGEDRAKSRTGRVCCLLLPSEAPENAACQARKGTAECGKSRILILLGVSGEGEPRRG